MRRKILNLRKPLSFALALILLTVLALGTAAYFTDRADSRVSLSTASFTKDGYGISRVVDTGPYVAGETISVEVTEDNKKNEPVQSIVTMTAQWLSPDTTVSPFGNANDADNVVIKVDGTQLPDLEDSPNAASYYSYDKSSGKLTIVLPVHKMESSTSGYKRVVTLGIPDSLKSTGTFDIDFTGVKLSQTTSMGTGFYAEFSHEELNADSSKPMDFTADVVWDFSKAQNKAIIGRLTGSNGNFGLTVTGTGEMYNWSSGNASRQSKYSGSITSLSLSDNITTIGDNAFNSFSKITNLDIPGTVTSIGDAAFNGIGIKSLIVPAAVTELGKLSFGNCYELTKITFDGASTDIQFPTAGSDSGAFFVGSPYTVADPLRTEVVTSNQKVLDYDWSTDHRGYTITVKKADHGKTETDPSVSAVNGKTITIKPTPDTGYLYSGSNVNYKENGSDMTLALAEDKLTFTMPASDITITSRWTPISYTVKYDANGGTGSTEDSAHTYDAEKALNKNAFTRVGYEFAGWAETKDGDVKYADEAKVKNLTSKDGETITLYAKWQVIDYKVTYVPNGGTMPDNVDTVYNVEDHITKFPEPTRRGYEFKGWYEDEQLTDGPVTSTEGETGDKTYYAKWEIAVYDINYDLNGGSLASDKSNPATYTMETDTFTLNNPTRTGYIFAGWTGSNGDTPNTSVSVEKGSTGDLTYKANWTPITYSVKYDANTGTGDMSDSAHTYDVEKALNKNAFTKTGFKFIGWAETKDGAVKYADEAKVKNLTAENGATVTLYAKWEIINYKITYVPNGGTMPDNVDTVYNVEDPVIGFPEPTKRGYDFSGWYEDEKLTDGPVDSTEGETGDKTYYAKWTPITYGISYDLKGGSLASGKTNPSSYTIETETFTLNNPTRTGYIFDGWTGSNDDTPDTSVSVEKGSIGAKSYTANWTAITYKIKYNANTGSGTMADSEHTYDVAKNLTKNAFTKTGYNFIGWAESADGSVKYDDQASVKNLTATDGATINLYAKWEPRTDTKYVVKHWQQNLDGGAEQNSTNFTLKDTDNLTGTSDAKVTPAVKTYEGFTSPSPQQVTIAADGSTVVNYYYTRNSYTVGLSKGTGIESVTGAGTYKYGAEVTINATLSNGYTWSKWTGTHNTNTQEYTFTMPAGNVTDTANAVPTPYAITYELNGGSLATDKTNPSSYTIETDTFTLNNPTRTGYTFTGWTGSNGDTPDTSVSVEKGSTGAKSYTANWVAHTYKVKYDANTGSGTMADSEHTYDVAKKLNKNAFTKTGYEFIGWATSASGDAVYDDEESVKNLTSENGATVTLYAKWLGLPVNYTVKHWQQTLTGGSTQNDTNFTLKDTETLTGPTGSKVTPARKSYEGFTAPEGQTVTIAGDGSTVVNYYYNRNSYTLTLVAGTGISDISIEDSNGASANSGAAGFVENLEKSVKYGDTVTINALADSGYTWSKWTGTHSTATQAYTFTMPASNVTDTANATVNTYTISYNLNGGALASGKTNPTSYTVETETFTLNNPTKTGYTFKGWTGSNGSSANTSVTIAKGSTGNKSYTANWTANTNTAYKVQHWQQTLTGGSAQNSTNFTLKDTDNLTGTTGASVTPARKSYTGFTAPAGQTVTIAADGSTVVNYYYTRNSYTVSLTKGSGISSVSGAGTYKYGASVTIGASVSGGYTWNKWTGTHSTTNQSYTFTMPASNVSDTANATVVTYSISYNLNGGSVSGNPTSYTVETPTFTLKNPSKTGYTFKGWTGSNGNTAQTSVTIAKGSTGNKSYTANWTANTNTAYKVQHWQQTLTGGSAQNSSNFSLVETQNLTGTTGASVTPGVKSYAGFTSPSTQTVTIAANGSTVVNYYYTRNSYTVSLGRGTGVSSVSGAGTYKYGASVTINASMSAGYQWSKWTGTHNTTTQGYTFSMPASNVSDTANATAITYTITYNLNGGSVSSNPTTYTVETATFTLNNPTKTKYGFSGWTGSNGSTAQTTVTIAKGSTGNKSYTANWYQTAQAIYSATDNSLTFIRDRMYSAGETYNGKTVTNVYTGFETASYSSASAVPWNGIAGTIKSVVVEDQMNPVSTAYWFYNFQNCKTFTVGNLNTAGVSSMRNMFQLAGYNVDSFTISGMDSWNVSSVLDMGYMFALTGYGASEFNIGNLGKWTTSNLKNIEYMFNGAGYDASEEFYIGDLSSWTTSGVTSLAYTFADAGHNATSFNIGNLGKWDTSNVTSMVRTFSWAGAGEDQTSVSFYIGDLSTWNTAKVKDMNKMFMYTAYKATSFDIGSLRTNGNYWNVSGVENMRTMFNHCAEYATTFNIGDISNWNTANVQDMTTMFGYCGVKASYSLNLSGWNVSNCASTIDNTFNGGVTTKVKAPVVTSAASLDLNSSLELPKNVTAGEDQIILTMPDVSELNAEAAAAAPENTVFYGWLVDSGMAQLVVLPEDFEEALNSVYGEEPEWEMIITPLYQTIQDEEEATEPTEESEATEGSTESSEETEPSEEATEPSEEGTEPSEDVTDETEATEEVTDSSEEVTDFTEETTEPSNEGEVSSGDENSEFSEQTSESSAPEETEPETEPSDEIEATEEATEPSEEAVESTESTAVETEPSEIEGTVPAAA